MNRKITCFVCLVTMLLAACSSDEPQTRSFVVTEFEDRINNTVIFQTGNRAYVATVRNAEIEPVTDVYRVDLLSGEKAFVFSTDGSGTRLIVSADEELIAIGAYPLDPSVASPSRLELFDLSTNTKTVLKSAEGFFVPLGFDQDNKTLLYARTGTSEQEKIRTINLASGEEDIISYDGSAGVIAINPVTYDILMNASSQYFFTDWNGMVIGEPITGFDPQFFSPDGKEIIGCRGMIFDHTGSWNYQEVVRYTIATGEIESLTGTETTGVFGAASMSPDQNFVVGLTNDSRDNFLDDLYVVNTVTLERNKLMSTRLREQAIGFFDSGRKVLFVTPASGTTGKNLYGIKVD